MPSRPPHPLRRISTGSLSSLARSADRTRSPSDLDFLAPALSDMIDEAATLASNTQRLNMLHDALGTFNEGFAAYLYAIKMNAFSMAWPEAPIDMSWERVRAGELALPPPGIGHSGGASGKEGRERGVSVSASSGHGRSSPAPTTQAYDMTYATAYSDDEDAKPRKKLQKTAPATGIRKPATNTGGAAAKRAAIAAKKRREIEISTIIDSQLPLEYRGGDADARLCMEKVIDRLWDGDGLAISDLVKPPEMPHPKVNKCLIALVAKKLVGKSAAKGKTLYSWVGM